MKMKNALLLIFFLFIYASGILYANENSEPNGKGMYVEFIDNTGGTVHVTTEENVGMNNEMPKIPNK